MKDIKETFSTLRVSYIIGLIWGCIEISKNNYSHFDTFEKVIEGILFPISYGFAAALAAFVICFIYEYLKDKISSTWFVVLMTVISVLYGLIVVFH